MKEAVVIAVADRDRVSVAARDRFDRALTGDPDVADAFVLAAETGKLLLMMRRLGERVSLRAALETAALGRYYDCVTPSGAGGQPFQIWYLRAGGYSAGAAAAMPLLGFFTRQTGLVILTLGVFALGRGAVDSAGIPS